MNGYFLPNGMRIDFERIVDAALAEEEYPQIYLDTEIGLLIEVASHEMLGKWVVETGSTKRYYLIERYTDDERDQEAGAFIDIVLKIIDTKKVAKARAVLTMGGWRALEDFLQDSAESLLDAWDHFLNASATEYVHEWLTNNPDVAITVKFKGCGNCVVCALMERGEEGDIEKAMDAVATEGVMQHVHEQMARYAKGIPIPTIDSSKQVYTFKITLNHSSPRIWRRIVVPGDYTFFDLHCAIQDAMGWTDSHLHTFRIDTELQNKPRQRGGSNRVCIEFPNPEREPFLDSGEVKDERAEYIADWFGSRITQCIYGYDFGDSWEHTVILESIQVRKSEARYPQCTAGKNACPPEDCGGIGGYEHLQKVLQDPSHEEYADMLDWLSLESPEDFDLAHFDSAKVRFVNPKKRLKEYEKNFGIEPL